MKNLDVLLAERQKSVLRVKFTGSLETQYRASLRRQLRVSRVLMFLLFAAGFAVAPVLETMVFKTPASLHGMLHLVAWLVSPLALLAAVLSYFSAPRLLTQAVQSAAVVVICAAPLWLRHLALLSSFEYPAAMLGVIIAAIAIFGSFNWYRLAFLATVFFSAGIVQEFYFQTPASTPILSAYVLFSLLLISTLGAFSNEILRRQSWLQGTCAQLLSRTDLLTGLSNRADFSLRLPVIFNQARRDQKLLVVVVLDIDHFKKINDQYGHQAGDQALKLVGAALRTATALRPLDIVARSGGEEFVVVWYDVAEAAIARLVESLQNAIRTLDLPSAMGNSLKITASAGVTWLIPVEGTDPERVIAEADRLMYRAKEEGRDRALLAAFSGG